MSAEIQLISDGDGVAIIGDPGAVERFLLDEGLPLDSPRLPKLARGLGSGAAGAQAVQAIAESSGRWVKLTPESVDKIKKFGLTPTKAPGVSHAMAGKPGQIKGWLQISTSPTSMLTNPALLSGGAGILAQAAMEQSMAEVTEYLKRIDAKLDDVLRAQKDTILAQMIGVGSLIDEAMKIREHTGRVNDVTWSKVQTSTGIVVQTQAFALLQLDAMTEKLEATSIGDLTEASSNAAKGAREWLAVLARCFQLLDGIAVLELDRVMETSPDDLDGHRRGLRAAREERRDAIAVTTGHLLARLAAASTRANDKVLFNPWSSPEVVEMSAKTSAAVLDFTALLGLAEERELVEARRWGTAAGEVRDKAVATTGEGVEAMVKFSTETGSRAKLLAGRVSGQVADQAKRLASRGGSNDEDHHHGKGSDLP